MENRLFLVLLAAGSSTRMGTGTKKEYMPLESGTVLSVSLKAFLRARNFKQTIIVIPQNQEKEASEALQKDKECALLFSKTKISFVEGGNTRQKSVKNALLFLHNSLQSEQSKCLPSPVVLIHDAARPFVSKAIIEDAVSKALKYGAAVPSMQPVDTQKELNPDGTIKRHLKRSSLGAVQTPQAFLLEPLLECHKRAEKEGSEYTDDSEIWDSFPECTGGLKIHTSLAESSNKKITFIQDVQMTIRTGFGTDLHRLVEGRKFMLGGIEIPCPFGEEAHSDGDVLLHAITDALLGAAAMGDIGSYFPPEDAKWKDADSKLLLKTVWNDIKRGGWNLNNMDCVVECEKPKLLSWRQKIIDSIASILEVESDKIFVKAKTNEKLDAVGRGEAVKAYCSCLLTR